MSISKFLCLLLILCLLPVGAGASPGLSQFRCTLSPSLNVQGVVADPFDRWSSELAAMITPQIRYAEWPEGRTLSIDVLANGSYAFDLNLLVNGEMIGLSTSLMGDGWVLLTGDAALDALTLMDNVSQLLAPEADWPLADCTLTMHAGRIRAQLDWNANVLARWAKGAEEAFQEPIQAMAAALQAAAELIGEQPDGTPLLSVFVHYEAPDLVPDELPQDARVAPVGLPAALADGIPELMIRTIAELGTAE